MATDVLSQLPVFRWRGQAYPVQRHRVSFRHEGVEHTIQYRDFEFIEQLGAHGLTFSYTLPMRETIAKGPYRHLFEQGVPQLTRDMLNRAADTLEDPIFGQFRCVPTSYDGETDMTKRCGIDIAIEFRHSPELTEEDPSIKDLSGVAGITNNAGKLDEEVARADWGQEPSPEPSVDVLQAIDGVGAQGLAQIGKVSAALDDFAFKCEKIEATCDKVENPQNWPIRDSARRNRELAHRLKKRLSEDPATKIRQFVTRSQMLISELAKEVGMTLEELIKLNPQIVRFPYVRANTPVVVRAKARPIAA